MTTYAHIDTNGTIIQVGALPKLWHDGTRWHDWRDLDNTSTNPADYGWLPVAETPRPDDTATTTHDRAVELVAGVPTVTWTPRPWTAAELAARAERSARLDDLAARVARIEAHLWPAPPDPTDPDDPSITEWTGVWPDKGLLRDGGTVWRNVSGVPLTTPPSGFPGTPAQWTHLFIAVLEPAPGPAPWVQPTGAHDDYDLDALVTHLGSTWISTVPNNVWEPGVYGWSLVP